MRNEGQGNAATLRGSIAAISNPENLDDSVAEVFGTMLGLTCSREDSLALCSEDNESLSAVVGLGGILTGACIVRCDAQAARQIASLMTATECESVDDVVKDAMGEICNMLAGAWKSRVRELAANCGLSLPAVITGRDYNLHIQAPEFRISHRYSCGHIGFDMVIVCDSLQ